ncbi:hypothetical protein OSB04_029797 [Centaurea solstitialis]|uniref:Uncharacterized protein n=1 Tax=Centaurea solstitialis TaxID=347529 RepID=A0AA38W4C0_9ASTR|nr:hypothetical protein OSB04_029797 [Centaurea solstitialis]
MWKTGEENGCGKRVRKTDVENGCGKRVRKTGEENGCGKRVWKTDVKNGCGKRVFRLGKRIFQLGKRVRKTVFSDSENGCGKRVSRFGKRIFQLGKRMRKTGAEKIAENGFPDSENGFSNSENKKIRLGFEESQLGIDEVCQQKGVVLKNFYYFDEWRQVDAYCNRFWPSLLISLRNLYVSTTWKTLTIIAAVVIFILTLVQTIYTGKYPLQTMSQKEQISLYPSPIRHAVQWLGNITRDPGSNSVESMWCYSDHGLAT